MVNEAAFSQWNDDQLDPDNWLRIPEFNVRPVDVGFEGFSLPIVDLQDGSELVAAARATVKELRRLAMIEFASLADLRQLAAEGLEISWSEDSESPVESDQLTAAHVAAMRYQFAMLGLEAVLLRARPDEPMEWQRDREHRALESFASASLTLLQWQRNEPYEPKNAANLRALASAAGRASGDVRRNKGKLPPPDELRRLRDELVALGREEGKVAGILARRFDVTPKHIRTWLEKRT